MCQGLPECSSCVGHCGFHSPGNCWCEPADFNHAGCHAFGDCCPDVCEACPETCIDSCENYCGGVAPASCWCDEFCLEFGDCCDDICDFCTDVCPPADSCVLSCGGTAPAGCQCDSFCLEFGDCCADVCLTCPDLANCLTCSGTVVSSVPASGTIDARQPHLIDNANALLGIGSPSEPIRITTGLTEALPGCFTLCETAVFGTQANAIQSVLDLGNGSYDLVLRRPITPFAVTTIAFADGSFITVTSHPANVNGDTASSGIDILALIDVLNGVVTPTWGSYSTDIDHSGQTNPADVLRVIDLLNGAGEFDAYAQTTLPVNSTCPPN